MVVTGAERNPQVPTDPLMSQLAIKMESIMVNQVIQPWAEYQMNKIEQAALAYDMRKALPNSTQASHMAQHGNQWMENQAPSTNSQAVEMITNAGTQQQWVHNSGAVTFLDTNAMTRNLQAMIQNNEASLYWEYAVEKESVTNTLNTNVGDQNMHANSNNYPLS